MQQMVHRYCPHCGAPLGVDHVFCGVCGGPVDGGMAARSPVTLAPYGRRVVAWGIDVTIVAGAILCGAVLLVSSASNDPNGQTTGVGFIVWPVVPLYSALLHAFWHGQTIGKRLVGIAVTKPDGTSISLGQSLGRSYLRMAFWIFPPVWLLDSVWPLWQTRRQSLHDLGATTIVQRSI